MYEHGAHVGVALNPGKLFVLYPTVFCLPHSGIVIFCQRIRTGYISLQTVPPGLRVVIRDRMCIQRSRTLEVERVYELTASIKVLAYTFMNMCITPSHIVKELLLEGRLGLS